MIAALVSGCASSDERGNPYNAIDYCIGKSVSEFWSEGISSASLALYLGHWCDEKNAHAGVQSTEGICSIEIVDIDENSLTFIPLRAMSAPAYRITGVVNPVTAVLVGNEASFTFEDDRGGINQGTIVLDGVSLCVTINQIGFSGLESVGPGGSLSMDCVMVRDAMRDIRKVDESSVGNAMPSDYSPDDYIFVGDYYKIELPESMRGNVEFQPDESFSDTGGGLWAGYTVTVFDTESQTALFQVTGFSDNWGPQGMIYSKRLGYASGLDGVVFYVSQFMGDPTNPNENHTEEYASYVELL